MHKYLPLLIFSLLFVFSCKSSAVKPTPAADTVANDFPMTAGNTWRYGVATILDTAYYNGPVITVTMTGDSTQKLGKNFAVANVSSPDFDNSNKFYFRRSGGKYKTFTAVVHDAGENKDFEIPILLQGCTGNRDSSYFIPDADALLPPAYKIISQVAGQLQTQTVEGKTYKNCTTIQVYIDKRYDADPAVKDNYYMYRFYNFVFVPNVGIIKEFTNSQSMYLMSCDIKK